MSEKLDQKRHAILQQIQSIERLRRGSFSEQVLHRKKGSQTTTYGPYFVLQGFRQGEKFSERVSAEAAPQVAQDVQNYQRFQHLAEQFVDLTDQLTREQTLESGAKKNSAPPKSPPKNSRKPKPS